MVHRWAAGAVRGEADWSSDGAADALVAEGLASDDPLGWFDDGARDLLAALALTPDDPQRPFFLLDAVPGKAAWARRQCHETTIHAVDARSAALGCTPSPRQTWLRPSLAHDGVDELLCGFVPRRRVRLRSDRPDRPYSVVVRSTDTGGVWTLLVSDGPVVTVAGDSTPTDPVVEVSGSAVQLYLGLWNRGHELVVSDPEFLETWRRAVTVQW